MDDKVEALLEKMREKAGDLALGVASIKGSIDVANAKLDNVIRESSNTSMLVSTVQKDFADHEAAADAHPGIQAEVKRLWWGIGIVLGAIVPIAIKAIMDLR